jgi:endoglucanase
VTGYTCTYSSEYYSQCLAGSASNSAAAPASSSTKVVSTVISSTTLFSTSTAVAATSASPVSSATASSSGAAPAATGAALPFLGGVNTAGYDFSVSTDGSFSGTGVSPPTGQYQHFASEGVNVFRIPFAWQLMTPTLGGTIDASFLAKYDATVNAALSASTAPYVIIDLHSMFTHFISPM